MASVSWLKHTKQSISAMRKHNGKEERENYNHENKNIDKSRSHLNIFIGADDFQEMYEAMLKRITEVDAQYPPLRNLKYDERIICEILEFKCPKAVYEKGYNVAVQFFYDVHEIIKNYFGTENVHGCCVHFDEIHEYTDSQTREKEMSLAHGHELVSCYCEWTEEIKKAGKNTGEKRERKGINGKNFEKRNRYNELNKLVDDYCYKTYGIHYMTGKEARHKTVEILKAETELAEKQIQVEQEQQKLKKVRQQREEEENALTDIRRQTEIDKRSAEQARQEKDKFEFEADQSRLETQVEEHFYNEAVQKREDEEEKILMLQNIPPRPIVPSYEEWCKTHSLEMYFKRTFFKKKKVEEAEKLRRAEYDKEKEKLEEQLSSWISNYGVISAAQNAVRKKDQAEKQISAMQQTITDQQGQIGMLKAEKRKYLKDKEDETLKLKEQHQAEISQIISEFETKLAVMREEIDGYRKELGLESNEPQKYPGNYLRE